MLMELTNPHRGQTVPKKIWIDLDNSPHVPFFVPIIEELQQRGYSVLITARDAFQVCELAQAANLDYTRIGRHFGKHTTLKIAGLATRALQLIPIIVREKPDIAVSHGSRAQLVLSAVARIPSILIMDYEYARALILAGPAWVMVPEPILGDAIPIAKNRLLRYPGIKEDVYVPRFRPDPAIRNFLGIDQAELLVTIRPPANEAHYHNPESDTMFTAVLEFLGEKPGIRIVLLPRNHGQETAIRKQWPRLFEHRKLVVPEHAVDGLNLIWHSDLVISGGGTMNREAAALGVPVYSIFRGKIGAVDRYLGANGRLVLLESVADIGKKIILQRRHIEALPGSGRNQTLMAVVGHISAIADATGRTMHHDAQHASEPLIRN